MHAAQTTETGSEKEASRARTEDVVATNAIAVAAEAHIGSLACNAGRRPADHRLTSADAAVALLAAAGWVDRSGSFER